jgi:hypothetical protein
MEDVGARLVIRSNTFNDSSIVFHGGAPNDSSPNGGIRQFEVYSNTFNRVSNAFAINKWIWCARRHGPVIANNTMARADSPDGSSYPNKAEIRLSLACPNPYRWQYQVGQSSQAPQSPPTRPLLIFRQHGCGRFRLELHHRETAATRPADRARPRATTSSRVGTTF